MKKLKQQSEIQFANSISQYIHFLGCKDIFVVAGRGFSKTTEILTEAILDTVHELPRASFGLLANTYTNLMSNIVPTVLTGFERKKIYENYHYVVNTEPPDDWQRPYLKTFRYKHTISFQNGCKIFLLSGDRPDSAAGLSLAALFIDEAKYIKDKTIDTIVPTLRDNPLLYNNSPYFKRIVAVTDMPNITRSNEYDWILRQAENMDKELLQLIAKVASAVNDIIKQLLNSGVTAEELAEITAQIEFKPHKRVGHQFRHYRKFYQILRLLRANSTHFVNVSSLVNADVLGIDYFMNLFKTLDWDDFKKTVLSIEPDTASVKFFPTFKVDYHTYNDGNNYDYYDNFGIGKKNFIIYNCLGLKYLHPFDTLYISLDFGMMCSLVVSVLKNGVLYVIKELYTLNEADNPEYIPQLAFLFTEFFKPHKNKFINCFYDRAGNNYGYHGNAENFKREVEKNNSEFVIDLKSKAKGDVFHDYVYDLLYSVFEEKNAKLPKIRIDENNCSNLICSLKLAPALKDTQGRTKMDKSSEKRERLIDQPSKSTQLASAFVYLVDGIASEDFKKSHQPLMLPSLQ